MSGRGGGLYSEGAGCPCKLRSNASWIMVTWIPRRQNDGQTPLKILPPSNFIAGR